MNALIFGIIGVVCIVGMFVGYRVLSRISAERRQESRLLRAKEIDLEIAACQRNLDRLTARAVARPLTSEESEQVRLLFVRENELRDAHAALQYA
jgi:hypothetical protein